MFASANAAVGGVFTVPLKARNQMRMPTLGARVKDGLGIAPLRATGGSPGPLQMSGAARSSLVAPPASGGGILSQLQGQVRSASPLTAGVRSAHRAKPGLSSGLLQARQTGLLDRMRRSDSNSRLLQANSNPLRTGGGFGFKSAISSINLLG